MHTPWQMGIVTSQLSKDRDQQKRGKIKHKIKERQRNSREDMWRGGGEQRKGKVDSALILLMQRRCHGLSEEACREEGLHKHLQWEGRRMSGWDVCMGKQKRRESRLTGEQGCPCVFAHAGTKYYISRHGSLHFPLTSLRSGGLDPDSPHPASCNWKARFLHFLIYFKAHRQKERQLSLDTGRKRFPWETV